MPDNNVVKRIEILPQMTVEELRDTLQQMPRYAVVQSEEGRGIRAVELTKLGDVVLREAT